MDPLDAGDAGGLSGALDSVTETVESVERFANTVKDASSFEVAIPIVWAVVVLYAARMVLRFTQPWNEGAAERYRTDRKVFTNRRSPKDYEAEIARLNAQISDLMAQLEEAAAPKSSKPELQLVQQVD